MSMQPPSPAQMYIPPAAPPAPPAPLQQPTGSPTQFAPTQPGTGGAGGAGQPSFLASSAPAPATTGQRSLLGS